MSYYNKATKLSEDPRWPPVLAPASVILSEGALRPGRPQKRNNRTNRKSNKSPRVSRSPSVEVIKEMDLDERLSDRRKTAMEEGRFYDLTADSPIDKKQKALREVYNGLQSLKKEVIPVVDDLKNKNDEIKELRKKLDLEEDKNVEMVLKLSKEIRHNLGLITPDKIKMSVTRRRRRPRSNQSINKFGSTTKRLSFRAALKKKKKKKKKRKQ